MESDMDRKWSREIFYGSVIGKERDVAMSSALKSDFKPYEFDGMINHLISEGYIAVEKKRGKIYYRPTEKSIFDYGKEPIHNP